MTTEMDTTRYCEPYYLNDAYIRDYSWHEVPLEHGENTIIIKHAAEGDYHNIEYILKINRLGSQNGTTKLVHVKNQDTITRILDMVPDVVDRFTATGPRVTEEDVVEILDEAKNEK